MNKIFKTDSTEGSYAGGSVLLCVDDKDVHSYITDLNRFDKSAAFF